MVKTLPQPTRDNRLWHLYSLTYARTLEMTKRGDSATEIRAAFKRASKQIAALRDSISPSEYEAETYDSMLRRAIDDALAGRPPNVGPLGFGSDPATGPPI